MIGWEGEYAVPTYSYECVKCNHLFDVFHTMSAKPRVKCKHCRSRCRKLLGSGSGIIFKGSGFYETDFKDKKGTSSAKEKKADSKKGDASAGKAKSETKGKTEGSGNGSPKAKKASIDPAS